MVCLGVHIDKTCEEVCGVCIFMVLVEERFARHLLLATLNTQAILRHEAMGLVIINSTLQTVFQH